MQAASRRLALKRKNLPNKYRQTKSAVSLDNEFTKSKTQQIKMELPRRGTSKWRQVQCAAKAYLKMNTDDCNPEDIKKGKDIITKVALSVGVAVAVVATIALTYLGFKRLTRSHSFGEAVIRKDFASMKRLRGNDIHPEDDFLYWAILHGPKDEKWQKQYTFLTEQHPQLIHFKGKDGLTPLHWAVNKKNTAMVNFLLEKGASPDVRSDKGNTPLHTAVYEEDLDMVKSLLEKGASPNMQNSKGNTPLHWAMRKLWFTDGEEYTHKSAIISELLSKKARFILNNKDEIPSWKPPQPLSGEEEM